VQYNQLNGLNRRFMKHILHFVLFLFTIHLSYSQAPEKFSFQGVARNAAGKLVAGRDVNIRISIRPETALGSPIYQETHTAKTSANGVFNIEVGGGTVLSGQFSSIDWKSGKYFLQVEMDPEGGSSYVDLGATQLLSVPYAIHAAEAVEAASALHATTADEAGRWKNYEPIIQEGHYGKGSYLPNLNWDDMHKMMWLPRRGALRFGSWSGDYIWSTTNIGDFSFAGGVNAMAIGNHSFAFGSEVKANDLGGIVLGSSSQAEYAAIALGSQIQALGAQSVGIGQYVKSLGRNSVAAGYNLQSNSQFGIVLGMSNDISDAVDDDFISTQRLFQIGNGDLSGNRSNAVTVLRNGNVGIGNNVLGPTHILDVGARMRLRSNGNNMTAGLWLDNSNNVPYGFIGGFDNDQAGFYFENHGWVFTVNKNGTAKIANSLVQTSDRRLKRDIRPLTANFEKLTSISGRHYYWKDPQRSQGLQTGLIAQEVETVFPELVETDKDGFKSVNYIGLIPHLLEAVKELKQENARMQEQIEASSQRSLSMQTQANTSNDVLGHKATSLLALLMVVGLSIYVVVLKQRPI
jgi:hypothetical protein